MLVFTLLVYQMMSFKKCLLLARNSICLILILLGKKKVAREIVIKHFSNFIRNADHLMSKVDVEPTVQWVGKDEIRVDSKNDNLSNKV